MYQRWPRFSSPRSWLFGSLRRQLVTGMVLTIAGMLIPFVLWVAAHQASEARREQIEEAEVFAANLAASSAVWVSTSDIGGLRDIVGSFSRFSLIRHAMVTDRQGQVLAHNDASFIGKYLSDLPTLASPAILRQDARLVDVVAPIMLGGMHFGWARIGLDQTKTTENIARIRRNGLLFILIALVIGTLLAALAARRLTRRLTVIEQVAHVQQSGHMTLRAEVEGDDEAARLARQFNAMLDVLNRREAELTQSHDKLEQRVLERTAALEEQNRRNTLIVNAAMDGFFVADLQGRLLDCNDIYCAMLGYTRDDLLKLHVPEIEAIENLEEVARHIGRVIEQGHDRFDTRHRRKDGSLINVEVNVTLAMAGAQRQFFVFVHDISARKRDEAALIAARDEAEAANAAKSEFLSRMSHELRTPLNAILGFAQMLALPGKSSLTEQQADNVQEILKAGQHLLVQINEVLDLARIESGRIELNLEPLPIAQLIKDCIAQVQPLSAARGIVIAAQLNPISDESLALRGDYTRVKQVLLNLLSNAIKYNRDGGDVHVATVLDDEYLRIEVTDTGRGIAPEQRKRLFKPFERLESSYDGIEGTGIGLALVKQLVEAMGGKIDVESEEGIGSTFWFVLPAATLPSQPETAPSKVGTGWAAISTDVPSRAPHRVLYIEDNPANLKLMRKIIGLRPEFALLDAMNAELGLEIARREQPDLILLDINLPGMDGFAAIARLQAWPETATIPVIAVTANAMKHEIDRSKSAGFADYLTKPIDIARLSQILDEQSARKHL
jgi:PAS domain S-box-containing protein